MFVTTYSFFDPSCCWRLFRYRPGLFGQCVGTVKWRLCGVAAALTLLAACSAPPPALSDASIDPTETEISIPDGPPQPDESVEQNPQASSTPPPQTPNIETGKQLPEDLHQVLRDATQEVNRRRQAAVEMLARKDARTHQILIEHLAPGGDPVTQQLIVQAVLAMSQEPPQIFVEPLLALVARAQDPLLHDAAGALSRFKDREHIRRLIKLALDRSADVHPRRGAIIALGYYRDRHVTGKLVGLLQAEEPPTVVDAAYAALAGLTGIDHFDREQWKVWWAQHRCLSDPLWFQAIARSLADRNDRLVTRMGRIEDRLVEAQGQLYRATPQQGRAAMLITMLSDPLTPVRRLAISLCVQRLTDTEPIGPELRGALLDRFDDRDSTNRQRAALLLRDLADEAAAEAVAVRLMSGTEKDPEVLRVYLLMMAKLPRQEVLELAMRWLADPFLGGEAAGVLAAAVDAGLLGKQRGYDAAVRVRMLLDNSQKPKPKFIELLGRVGGNEDWQRIAQWVASDDDAIKQTAAQAWADSPQPLQGLVRYAGDPVIQPIVIAAARRRGERPETLMALVEHKPEQEQVVQAWRLAVVAVAGRVSPIGVVLEADRRLAQLEEPLEWRDQVLSAAIDQRVPNQTAKGSSHGGWEGSKPEPGLDETTQTAWIELLLTRAQVRLANGDVARALADYQLLEPMGDVMNTVQRNRLGLGLVRTLLAGSDVDAAIGWVGRWLVDPGDSAGDEVKAQIAQMFLDTVDRNVATEQMDVARRVLAWLRSFVGQSGSLEIQSRIHELEQRIDADTQGENATPGSSTVEKATGGSTQAQQSPTIPQTKPVPQK